MQDSDLVEQRRYCQGTVGLLGGGLVFEYLRNDRPAQLIRECAERIFVNRTENVLLSITRHEFQRGSLPAAAFSGDDQPAEGRVHVEVVDFNRHGPGVAVMFSKPFFLETPAGIFTAGSDGGRFRARRVHFVRRLDHRVTRLEKRVGNAFAGTFTG